LKTRLDQYLVSNGLVSTRSQAESFVRLGKVKVNGQVIQKPGYFIGETHKVEFTAEQQYVSRAGLKLASIADAFGLDFRDKTVLDVGSSTGGFTDFALQHQAAKVIAVEVGSNQLHPSLRTNDKVELHEQTDIRSMDSLSTAADIVVIDVSFISLRDVLPHIKTLVSKQTRIVAMVKPQFEAPSHIKHKGVIKNEAMRRDILKDFEGWAKQYFKLMNKADSQVAGEKGNRERFYLLQPL
jgi:23S rRNA (cytidine1920-2'-O)/16S rRNA (cytidine1409-2'-O)-methyltransferase